MPEIAVRIGRHADDWSGPRLMRPTPVATPAEGLAKAWLTLASYYLIEVPRGRGYYKAADTWVAHCYPWWVVALDGAVWRQGPAAWLDPRDWGVTRPRPSRQPVEAPPPWRPPPVSDGGGAW